MGGGGGGRSFSHAEVGGLKKFGDSFHAVAGSFSHIVGGGGARTVYTL